MMKEPTRLFDLPYYQLTNDPLSDMLAAKKDGKYICYSTQWFIETIEKLATSFYKHGIGFREWTTEKRDKIAILSENRPEWLLIDHAVQQCGAILVPIYPTINKDELIHIFNEAEIKWVFVSNITLYRKIESILSETPSVKAIYSFDPIEKVKYWQELMEETKPECFKKIEAIKSFIKPEDLTTIIYTSGTSGIPKGVMLSHHNILSNVMAGYKCMLIQKGGRALSFLPLNHVYERMMSYLYVYASIPIYFAESMATVGDDLREAKPYIFATVPRLLESVYEKIIEKGNHLTGLKRKTFFWSLEVGNKYDLHSPKSMKYKFQLAIANRLVFKKWRQALGGQVKTIITGSAACQLRLLRLFSAAGIIIQEGYGLTETSPVISVNRLEKKNRMFGTIGTVMENIEVKITLEGEILCKGPNIMMGYFKQPELTKGVLKDGWFSTGDVGEWIEKRFLKITDRKKELFKNSGGKYIAPLPIETKMAESPFIKQIMVIGSNQKHVSVLIVPDILKIANHLKISNIPELHINELIERPEVIQLIQNEIKDYNIFFNSIEQIKKFRLLPYEWTIENGELTPTLKLKRRVIIEKYQDIISSIYN